MEPLILLPRPAARLLSAARRRRSARRSVAERDGTDVAAHGGGSKRGVPPPPRRLGGAARAKGAPRGHVRQPRPRPGAVVRRGAGGGTRLIDVAACARCGRGMRDCVALGWAPGFFLRLGAMRPVPCGVGLNGFALVVALANSLF